MQSSTDRGRRIARHAPLWLAGPIVLVTRDGFAELLPPIKCLGGLEVLCILIARRWPDLTVGRLLGWLEPVAVIIALACVAEWFYRLTHNRAIAVGVAVLAGCGPVFRSEFAPPTGIAAIGICAAAAVAGYANVNRIRRSNRELAVTGFMLLVAAVIVPSWFLVCAVLAWMLFWSSASESTARVRVAVASAAAALVATLPLVMVRMTHHPALASGLSWYRCVLPSITSPGWPQQMSSQLPWTFGPLLATLAVLGVVKAISRCGKPVVAALVAAVVALVPAAGARPEASAAPIIVFAWSVAAIGLDEVTTMMRRARGGLTAAVLLLCILPVLELARGRADERDNAVRTISHERASLEAITSMLNLVPIGARFVEEDATVDLLLRASVLGGRRASKPLVVIPPTRQTVADAIRNAPVYAFPYGQALLGLRGFAIERADEHAVGVARVAATRPCRELGTSWVDLSAEGANGRIALVAETERDTGPAVLYFGGPTEYAPGPDGWPPRVRSGFELRLFDRKTPADAERLEAEARELAFQNHPVVDSPFVSQMFVRRMPRAPLQLPITLGPPRSAGIGRLREDASAGDRIAVCDAPPVTVSTF